MTTQIILNETHPAVLSPWLNSPRLLTCPREKWLSEASFSPNSQQFPSLCKHHCLRSLAYSATYSKDNYHFHVSLNDIKTTTKQKQNKKPQTHKTENTHPNKYTQPSSHTQSSLSRGNQRHFMGFFSP